MSSNLPQELILEILSRIPIKDVCTCKRVCRSWLNLLETPEFISSHLSKSVPRLLVSHYTSHLSKSVPRLLVSHYTSDRITVFQFLFDVEQCSRKHQKSNNNPRGRIECSIDGLILFKKFRVRPEEYYICNPITRKCVRLPELPQTTAFNATCGFGISRIGRKYKVVRMLEGCLCQVYTLGGPRTWRSIAGNDDERMSLYSKGTFLNGNLHWLVEQDSERAWWVSCFDLETEALTKFRAPTYSTVKSDFIWDIGVLRDCLCLCEFAWSLNEFVIYTMSCYEKKSWVRECVIRKSSDLLGEYVYPIKFFGDSNGGVLMAFYDRYCNLFCYSNKRTDLIGFSKFEERGFVFEAVLYTPSFVSPRDFGPGQREGFDLISENFF